MHKSHTVTEPYHQDIDTTIGRAIVQFTHEYCDMLTSDWGAQFNFAEPGQAPFYESWFLEHEDCPRTKSFLRAKLTMLSEFNWPYTHHDPNDRPRDIIAEMIHGDQHVAKLPPGTLRNITEVETVADLTSYDHRYLCDQHNFCVLPGGVKVVCKEMGPITTSANYYDINIAFHGAIYPNFNLYFALLIFKSIQAALRRYGPETIHSYDLSPLSQNALCKSIIKILDISATPEQ